ncbi:1483_t:CDS:2, partial [Gigaspora margarita]
MVKACNPSIKWKDLMDAANIEWQKCQKEPEIEIKKLINQYFAASPSIIQTTNFFLPPSLPTLESIQEASSKIKEYECLLAHTKKRKNQINDGVIEIYDTRGCPFEFQKNPELLDQIHKCVEFEDLQDRYNIYITQQTLSTYLLPRYTNTRNALRHCYPANIKISAVSRSEIKPHIDRHYCLASVKMARVFALTFTNYSLIISQDDKAKVGLGVPAV